MKHGSVIAAASLAAFSLVFAPGETAAAGLQTLSASDAQLYASAFSSAERGDAAAVDRDLGQVADPCLVGDVRYLALTGPAAPKASYGDLVGWLKAFAELPGAHQIYALAVRLKPAGERLPLPSPTGIDAANEGSAGGQSRAAREAYSAGDASRALVLAEAGGDDWMAGLAAYRQGDFVKSESHFEALARRAGESDANRAAGAFWAARSTLAAGAGERAPALLRIAAGFPTTFYGMIAQRRLDLATDPLGKLVEAAGAGAAPQAIKLTADGFESPGVATLVATDTRARRAVALAQIGRRMEAGAELRAGMALAADKEERWAWTTLAVALNPGRRAGVSLAVADAPPPTPSVLYPAPALTPLGGFTLDKALVYALAWRESRFDSLAVSPSGAIGLMQIMPASAASVTGEDWLKTDPIALFDPPTNLRIGQDYVAWLMNSAADHDILRALAAYNGGPATLQRAARAAGPGADSLLVIESAPFGETRTYVRKVMAAYWNYRRQFGEDSPTLDALASNANLIDARLDRQAAN